MLIFYFSSSMEETPRIPMEKPGKIIRGSIHTFLKNYHYFTTTSALLALPFSASILLSTQSFFPSSFLQTLYSRLENLFQAAGFPPSSGFFILLNLKLSQTISANVFTLPFTLTFFLIAKASVIQSLNHPHKPSFPPSFSSLLSIFGPLLFTYTCNSFLILSANATALCLWFLSFNFLEGLGFSTPTSFLFLSASGAILYSIILANTLIICNLALVLSGVEKTGGCRAILKACVMIGGKAASTALMLALPVNLALAGVEALFQFRITGAVHEGETPGSLMILEGLLIAYLYSIFLVLDTILSYNFYKSCKAASSCCMDQDQDCRFAYRIEIAEENNCGYLSLKVSQEFPSSTH